MTTEIARLVVAVGAALAFACWAGGVYCLQRMKALPPFLKREDFVEGERGEELLDKVLRAAAAQPGAELLYRERGRADLRVLWSAVAVKTGDRINGADLSFELDFRKLDRKARRAMKAVLFWVAPLFLAGIPIALWRYAVFSDNVNFRWQAVQIAQTVHVLWPPFLFKFLHHRLRSRLVVFVNNLAIALGAREVRSCGGRACRPGK